MAVRITLSKTFMICEVNDTGLYDFGWFLWEPGFSIGHITAVFNSGAMSPLFKECLHSIYRGSLSSSAHSFKSMAGKRSVPGAALFLTSFIASIMDFCVKSISPSIGPTLSSLMEKNSVGLSILYSGSGWEKLEEYCSTNFIHISNKLVIFSPFISKGPILFLVLSFFLAYVKKYLGFDFVFNCPCLIYNVFFRMSNNFCHFPYGLFYPFLIRWDTFL